MHKVPNLYRNRLGTYYLRITVQGREVKRSLGTKDRPKAVRSALLFALARDEGLQFDTTALCEGVAHRRFRGAETFAPNSEVHRMEPMPQGEPMKNIPSVLRKGRGASDIPSPHASPEHPSGDQTGYLIARLGIPDQRDRSFWPNVTDGSGRS